MNSSADPTPPIHTLPLEDFGQLQARYQALKLADRATAVLADGELALKTAEAILAELATHPKSKSAFDAVRKNAILVGRMRGSEAKNLLMEGGDFIEAVRKKLAAWRKTMGRLSKGEGISNDKGGREFISRDEPLSLALAGNAGISNFLSVIQLALAELSKLDEKAAAQHASSVTAIRRCATILGDCEHASGIQSLIH